MWSNTSIGTPPGFALVEHQRWDCADQYGLGDTFRAVAADVFASLQLAQGVPITYVAA
jgi:hypothetical protein